MPSINLPKEQLIVLKQILTMEQYRFESIGDEGSEESKAVDEILKVIEVQSNHYGISRR